MTISFRIIRIFFYPAFVSSLITTDNVLYNYHSRKRSVWKEAAFVYKLEIEGPQEAKRKLDLKIH